MSSSLNQVNLIGNLGDNPTVHRNKDSIIVNLSLATSTTSKDKNTGNKVEKTEWHRIVLYQKLAEIAEKYLSKGDKIHIRGKIRYGRYTDKEGIERYTTDIVGHELLMLGSKNKAKQEEENPYKQAEDQYQQHEPETPFEDDIPF